jgi:hypothetical protein
MQERFNFIAHQLGLDATQLEQGTDAFICKLMDAYSQKERGTASKLIAVDAVNHPYHYTQGGIECIDAIAAATHNLQGMEAVCVSQVIKYTWRYKRKNGVEDLRKAQWYLNKLITTLESKDE